MKIVLIQPKAYKHAPDWVSEPLNLGYLASFLRQKGYSDSTIKIAAWEDDDSVIQAAAQADIVGITATSPLFTHGRELARHIKAINKDNIVIFGGAHPSSLPSITLEDRSIDIVVRGEGEQTFFELIRAIEQKRSLDSVLGISFRSDSGIVHNGPRPLIENLDSIPFPARDLMQQKRFSEIHFINSGIRVATVFSSRGCPFHCIYCGSHAIWTRRCRMRSPKNILAEIEELRVNYKIKRIYFYDDTFTIDKNRVFQFCAMLKAKKWKLEWGCNVHVNTITLEMLDEMKKAGCIEVWMGVESGSQRILDELKKGSKLFKIKEAFRLAKDVGLKRHAYMMVGAPSDSHESIEESRKLIEEIQPDYAAVTIFTPYPGCEAFDWAKSNNYVNEQMDWSSIDLHFSVTMPTQYLSKDELAKEHALFSKETAKYSPRGRRFKTLYRWYNRLKNSKPKEMPKLFFELTRKIFLKILTTVKN